MDLVDSAAGEVNQLTSHATRHVATQTARVSVSTTGKAARMSVRVACGLTNQTLRGLAALLSVARHRSNTKRQEGEVGLRDFTRLADGKREIVGISDKAVARQLARELRQHGVIFSKEKHPDGSATFHVQGKDATLVEHALKGAATRIDRRIVRQAERKARREAARNVSGDDASARVLELDAEQKESLTDGIRDVAGKLREAGDVPDDGLQPAELETLADHIEENGTVALTEENVKALDQVLTEKGWQISTPEDIPEHLVNVVTAIDEERVDFETRENAPLVEIREERETAEQLRAQAVKDAGVADVLTVQAEQFDELAEQVEERLSRMNVNVTYAVDAAGEVTPAPQLAGVDFIVGTDGQAERTERSEYKDVLNDEIAQHRDKSEKAREGARDMTGRSTQAAQTALKADGRADVLQDRLNATRSRVGQRIEAEVKSRKTSGSERPKKKQERTKETARPSKGRK